MPAMSAEDHAKVTQAVAEAEQRTSGEIVTVVAKQSDGYSDIALAWSALFAFTLLTLCAFFPDVVLRPAAVFHSDWNAAWTPSEVFGIASSIGILAFLLAWFAQFWDRLRFALVPGTVKTGRAEDRAIDLFKVGAERRTRGRTGVLIYVSLLEHRAEIVADKAIVEKVDPQVWGDAMAHMLADIRHGRLAEGIAAGVRDVGIILAEHFPRAADDTNEIPDRLIEL